MLTVERARELLAYDPETGWITSATNRGKWHIGHRVGHIKCGRDYKSRAIMIDGKAYKEHRVVWLLVHGVWPPGDIDHINGDARDNRYVNLRVVDKLENNRNAKRPKSNTSGIIGVGWYKRCGKYRADIKVMRRKIHLGLFDLVDEAIAARKAAELQYGFHVNHGR